MLRPKFFDEKVVDLAVDNVRQVLYTADSYGDLSIFYLGPNGDESLYPVQSYNLFDKALEHLRYERYEFI